MTLRDAGVSLIDCDHRTPPAAEVGFPYVAIPQIANDRIDFTTARKISREHLIEWTRKAKPAPNDVVLSRRCNPGETAPVTNADKFALGQNLVLLRSDGSKVRPDFLRWLVSGPEWWEQIQKFLNVGAVFDSLRCADVPKFELTIPPVAEQERIAVILGSLDDKIDLNRKMSETLEAMARALFRSWFVDFDLVRAKAGVRDTWLPRHIDELFPDAFEESELGRIPQGWRVATFDEHLDVARGLSYKGEGLSESGMPMHNLNSVLEGGGYKFGGIKHYVGPYEPRHVIAPGDVIVANTEQGHNRLLIGYAATVPMNYPPATLFSHHLYRVRPRVGSPLTPDFICAMLNSPQMHDLVSGFANGTTVNMLPMAGLQIPRFALPPSELIVRYNDTSRNVTVRREGMVIENAKLTALRNTLLPTLLSGAPRVRAH